MNNKSKPWLKKMKKNILLIQMAPKPKCFMMKTTNLTLKDLKV